MLNESQLRTIMPNAGARLDPHVPFILAAIDEAHVDTPRRVAAFLAQLAHESGEYRYMEELADGSAYEGRLDLGNTQPGDGKRFKGHGPIQITGRSNHQACGAALGLDLTSPAPTGDPRLLCTPEHGTRSAAWFWNSRQLSLLADQDWFREITRRVNGGYNGLADRLAYYARARQVLGLPPYVEALELESIKAFQRAHGLAADGVVGPATMAALAPKE